ncbi:MAG: rhodanese-like domain-containing protein [Candidatus Lernaella stagnicola]|nr:rhodanese-like domain-containing protein [Candidatus Lernaella stagnicola]
MKKQVVLIIVIALLSLGMFACGGADKSAVGPTPVAAAPPPPPTAAPAAKVFATIPEYKAWAKKQAAKTVSVDEAKTMIEAGKFKAIIDVREPGEVAEGHLPGAVNIPRGVLEFKIGAKLADVPKDAPILLYCKHGARGGLSAGALKMIGYTNVTNMDGGFDVWAEKGMPSTKDPC